MSEQRMAEKLALKVAARNRALAKAWLTRHNGSQKPRATVAHQ